MAALTVASHVGLRDQMAKVISEPLFRERVDASLPHIEERLAASFAEITEAKYDVTIAWGRDQDDLAADVGRLVEMVRAMGDALGVYMYERAGNEYKVMESPPFATDWRGMPLIATRGPKKGARKVPTLVFPPPAKWNPPPGEAPDRTSSGGAVGGAHEA